MERGALDPHVYDESLPRTTTAHQSEYFDRCFREMLFRQFNIFPNDAASMDVRKYTDELWVSGDLPKYNIVSTIEVEGLDIEFVVVEQVIEEY